MALAHFAALYAAWGPERMEAWLKQLKANEPQIYPTDDEVRQAVVSGRAIIGLAASDEAPRRPPAPRTCCWSIPTRRASGPSCGDRALRPKTAKNREAAQKLAERLADRSIEQLLVARVPGYLPLRSDIPVPPGVRSASNLVVISVDPARIVSEIGQRKASLAAWAASIRNRSRPGPRRRRNERDAQSDFATGRPLTSGRIDRGQHDLRQLRQGRRGCCATTSAARLPMSSSRGISPLTRVIDSPASGRSAAGRGPRSASLR